MTILTKEQWETSVAEAWSASIKATYQHLIDEAVKVEREACAEIADRLPRIYRETEEAHYRLSPEPFKPSNFGFDFAELKQAEAITHAIRARGQA